jgi:solute carrier family 25 (mitochondrial carnitine/acylcarnitine transporter), member 20/29
MECPFEYAKVRRQTGQSWQFSHIYKGFLVVNVRNAGLLTSFFIMLDSLRRNTKAFETKFGQFLATGTAACLSFWFIWPFEFIKN